MREKSKERTDVASTRPSEASSRYVRFLWNVAGTFFLSLGLIGVAVPLLPTTPFLLLAAACYLRGSRRMYHWMWTNRYFGTYLRDYMERKGMPWKVKVGTLALLWGVIGFSALVLTDSVIVQLVLLAVAIGVTIHILAIKTKKEIPDRQ